MPHGSIVTRSRERGITLIKARRGAALHPFGGMPPILQLFGSSD
jgi:hypothetical protein